MKKTHNKLLIKTKNINEIRIQEEIVNIKKIKIAIDTVIIKEVLNPAINTEVIYLRIPRKFKRMGLNLTLV